MTLSIFSEKSSVAKKEFNPDALPEAGSQLGILVQVIDLGVQPAKEYRDPKTGVVDKKRPQRTIRLTFELPADIMQTEDGPKPKVIGIDIPLSSNDKSRCFNWYRVFDSAMANNGDWFAQIGKGILLTIVHDKAKSGSSYEGWTFAKIGGVTPLMRGMAVPAPVNPLVRYTPNAHDQVVFDNLPKFLQDKINNREGGTRFPQAEKQRQPQAQPAASQQYTPQQPQQQGAAIDQDW